MSGSLSLKVSNTPTRTYGSPTSAASTTITETTTTSSADLLTSVTKTTTGTTQSDLEDVPGSSSKTIWDKISSPSNLRSAPGNTIPAMTISGGTILQPTVV